MPRTKNALIRQRVIDKCLSSAKKYSIRDLMDACNIELESLGEYPVTAMNTIRDDLEQIMANYPEANIISYREGRNIYYTYEDKSYSIFNIPLNDEEVAQLTHTITVLSRFEGMPQFEWMEVFIERFKTSLNIPKISEPIVGFDENLDLRGRNYFTTLFQAISNKQVLSIIYKNFKYDVEKNYIIHPYYLKQYNGRWFLVAFSQNIGKLSIFAFDRIKSIQILHTDYIQNTDYDFNEYFDDMIGVTKPDSSALEIVKIRVSNNRWPYIETKPLHGTQKVIFKNDEGVIIQIQVYLNKELEQLIMSFGADIEVIEPQSLRQLIHENLIKSCSNYK